MNEYEELIFNTFLEWIKEYPIEWIDVAYKKTVEAYKESSMGCCEFVERMKADAIQQNADKQG